MSDTNGISDPSIDHDRLFKTLLTTFFVDFVALFLPEVSAKMEPDSLEFLSQEFSPTSNPAKNTL